MPEAVVERTLDRVTSIRTTIKESTATEMVDGTEKIIFSKLFDPCIGPISISGLLQRA